MKQYILISIIFFAACTQYITKPGNNLNFLLLPDSIIKAHGNANDQNIPASIFLVAKSVDVELSWSIKNYQLPKQWEFVICDNVACHLTIPDKQVLEIIKKSHNEKDNPLKVIVKPNEFAGEGWIEISITESNNNLSSDLKFQFTIK